MGVLAPELQTQSAGPISRAFRISLLAIPLSTLIGVSVAYLNTVGRFAYPGLSVLLFNTVLCIYLFSSTLSSFGLIGFAAALVVANLFRLGLQVSGMREMFRWPKEAFAPIDRGFLRVFLFGVASYALVVAVGVIFRTIHAHGGDGLLSAFNYAIKLFELPTALMVAPVATVFLPLLSAEAQLASDSFEQKFLAACGAAWALSTSAALLGHQFMAFLVARIYGYGSMTAAGQADVAAVAKIMMFGLPAFALFQMGSVALNAKGLTHRVFWATSFGLGTGIAIARLAQYLDVPNHAALGFAAFQWAAAFAVLSSLDLTQGLKKTLARTALTSAGQAALVVLPIAAAAKYFISDSNVLLGAALLVATGLTALISLTYIRPLKAIRVPTD
jgi:peptidoglycan biosynthesis protein MviN/MurJ (putative lipid II flippase)